MTALACLGLGWAVLSVPAAVLIGRGIARSNQRAEAMRRHPSAPPTEWSQAATDAEFAALIPGLVTANVFALDNAITRRARGWTA